MLMRPYREGDGVRVTGRPEQQSKVVGILLTAGLFLMMHCLSCTPSPYSFTLSNNYTREKFSGRDISAHRIALFPLLASGGIITGPKFPSADIAGVFRKVRPDLNFLDADTVRDLIAKALAPSFLDSMQTLLYKGEIAALQTEEQFWRSVQAEYLFVFRLRHGIDIRTFNQLSRKRIIVEAELWDCAAMETAMRMQLTGTCNRAGYSDREFLLEAFKTFGAALPEWAPAYDTKSW